MNFAQRTGWDLRQNRFAEILEKVKRTGEVYDLTVSNPTQCGFYYPPEIFSALSRGMNSNYDPDPHGLKAARDAVAAYYRSQGAVVSLDQIFLTASTSEAYGFLFRLLADPGDHIVFPKPSYPLFEFLAGLHDLDWRTYALVYEDAWVLDRKSFHHSLEDGARAVILVNPNNPTGSCLNREDRDVIFAESARRGIPIICDEVFLDYHYSGRPAASLAGNTKNLTFVLGGLSKALALPQMKCSWIVVNGPQALVAEAVSRLEIIADTFLSVNSPAQNALADWMALRPDIQRQILDRILRNRKFLEEELRQTDGNGSLLRSDGGWCAVVQSASMNDDEESFVVRLLEEERVCVHPGYFFDFSENGYFVLSLLPEEGIFQEGVRRFLKCLCKI